MSGSVFSRRWANLSGPLVGFLGLFALFTILTLMNGEFGSWMSVRNVRNSLLHKFCIHGIIALGMLMIIISGGIDLSVGSVVSLVTVVSMQVYRMVEENSSSTFPPSIAAIGAGVGVGCLCGAFNGLIITRLKLTPFVVTLGMMSIARGLSIWLSGRTRISFRGDTPGWVDSLAEPSKSVVFFDPGVWAWVLLSILIAFVLKRTVFGRYVYAIGSNESTARLCGINVERTRFKVYCFAGLFTGLAGIIQFAQINGGDPNTGQLLELEVIAAVIIGGAALAGGVGTVSGTIIGVLILALIENSVNFLDVMVELKYILIGIAVILNTAISRWKRVSS